MDYVIHRGGLVTFEGEAVGRCVTGDDGLAYVEFFDDSAPPAGQHVFHGDLSDASAAE